MSGLRRFGVVLLAGALVACSATPAVPSATQAPTAAPPASPPAPPTATPTVPPTAPPTLPPTAPPTAPPSPSPEPTPTAPPTPSPSPSPSPTPAVTTVRSADRFVSVEIPDGALPAGVTVSIEARPAAEAAPELKKAGVSPPHYALLPAGTKFSVPVRVSQTYPRSVLTSEAGLSIVFLAIRSEDGKWEWLADAEVRVTSDSVITSGTTDHFTDLYVWSDRTEVKWDPGTPRTDLVGTTFTRRIEAKSRDARTHEINFTNVIFYNYAPEVIAVGDDKTGTPSAPKTIINRDWTCVGPGDYGVEFWAAINEFGTDNPFFPNTLGVSKHTGVIKIDLPGMCVTELPKVEIEQVCVQVIHQPLGDFLSHLRWLLKLRSLGPSISHVEVLLQGANDDQPVQLTLSPEGFFSGDLGLKTAGPKKILSVKVHYTGGDIDDITSMIIQRLGSDTVNVPPPPAEPSGGDCTGVPPPPN